MALALAGNRLAGLREQGKRTTASFRMAPHFLPFHLPLFWEYRWAPFRHRWRRGAAVGLPDALGRHRLQAAGRPLPVWSSGYLDKVQVPCRDEVVIGGYTTTNGAFRSLIAGVNRDGKLVEVGRIGTGFGRESSPASFRSCRRWRRPSAPSVARLRRESLARCTGYNRSWWRRLNTRASQPTVCYGRRHSRL
jgi:hypothetical protein